MKLFPVLFLQAMTFIFQNQIVQSTVSLGSCKNSVPFSVALFPKRKNYFWRISIERERRPNIKTLNVNIELQLSLPVLKNYLLEQTLEDYFFLPPQPQPHIFFDLASLVLQYVRHSGLCFETPWCEKQQGVGRSSRARLPHSHTARIIPIQIASFTTHGSSLCQTGNKQRIRDESQHPSRNKPIHHTDKYFLDRQSIHNPWFPVE